MMKSRVVRVDDALWDEAGERAAFYGFSRAEFIRRCVQHGIAVSEKAQRDRRAVRPFVPTAPVIYDPMSAGEWETAHREWLDHFKAAE